MVRHLSRLDVKRLSRAVQICASPFDYPTIDEWRTSVFDGCAPLVHGDRGHFDLIGVGLANQGLEFGYPDGAFQEWWGTWRELDPALPILEHHKLVVSTRRYRQRIAGKEWTAQYKRSRIYREFYQKHGIVDAASLYFHRRGVRVHLTIEADALARDVMDARARMLLEIIRPVLQAAVLSLARPNERHWQGYGVLNALNEPIAIVDARGTWIHRTAAFDVALAVLPAEQRAHLLADVQRAATRILRNVFDPRPARALDIVAAPVWNYDIFQLSATTIAAQTASDPSCLIRLSTRSGMELGHAVAAGLSKRECGVALLITEGRSNKAIANRLSISEHTARHHTESILRKLGISSRGAVAAALRVASRA